MGWRVALDSDAAPIDYVQILLFTDFSQLAGEQSLGPKDLPTAMTEEPSPSIAPPIPGAAKPAAGVAAKPAHAATAAKPATLLTAAEVAAREKARADARRAAAKAAVPLPPKKHHFGFL